MLLASGVSCMKSCRWVSSLGGHPPLLPQAPSLPSTQSGPPGPRLPSLPTPGSHRDPPEDTAVPQHVQLGGGSGTCLLLGEVGAPSPRYLRVKAEMQAPPRESAPSSSASHPPSQPGCGFFHETAGVEVVVNV